MKINYEYNVYNKCKLFKLVWWWKLCGVNEVNSESLTTYVDCNIRETLIIILTEVNGNWVSLLIEVECEANIISMFYYFTNSEKYVFITRRIVKETKNLLSCKPL